jgi:uncharacterized membrane protein YcaP (DUF421 family)
MMDILFAVLRAVIAYVLLLAVTRVIGRKAVSEMTFFNFITSITLGAMASTLAIGEKSTPLTAGIGIITFGVLTVLTSFIVIKSKEMSRLINSEPVVVIAKGEMVKKSMKRIRMNVYMLGTLLREKDVFNIMDVEYAIMENDGKLSVLLKSDKQPLTPLDMHIPAPYKGLMTDIISDGRLDARNLAKAGKNVQWLTEELGKKRVKLEDVFFASIDASGNLYITLGFGEE